MHTDPLAPVGPSPVGWPHRRSDLTVQDFFMDIPLWNLLGDAARTRRAAALMNILDVNPEWCEGQRRSSASRAIRRVATFDGSLDWAVVL